MKNEILTAKYRPKVAFNLIAGVLLLAWWFFFYEEPKFIRMPFGIEFDIYCLLIMFYVGAHLIISLFSGHNRSLYGDKVTKDLDAVVLVPIYNEDPISIKKGLESLFRQTHSFTQIHVQDDGSQANYDEIKLWFLSTCQQSGILGTWERQENAGKREAHVEAISRIDRSKCDIVVTIDSDTILDPEAVKQGIIPFWNPKVMSVAGLVISKNVNTNLLTRLTDILFVAHQRLIDRASQGVFSQVAVNDGPLAFYRLEAIDLALESGYTSETFRGNKVGFSDDSYFTLAAMLLGKTTYQPTSIAFTDMPVLFSHHRRQQLRWFRGSFIRGIWRMRYLPFNRYAWWRQFMTLFIFFSSSWILAYLLFWHTAYTIQVMLPLAIVCSIIYGLRYFSVTRSDVTPISRFLTFLLTPAAIFWSMFILRIMRLYAIATNSKQEWGTRQNVEALDDAKEFETSFKKKKNIRLDVEGLRAFAVVSVVIYHFWNFLIPGGFVGVDVFFVISGFIIIMTVLREVKKRGRFSMRGFYGRRIRRILPAATLTLCVGAILVYLLVPMNMWNTFGDDIIAAALYFINFALAWRAVDYMAQGTGISPFQHFWSLSVEEQFYIVTPILMIVLIGIAKLITKKRDVREIYVGVRFKRFTEVYLVALIAIFALSLTFCISFGIISYNENYFFSLSRFWEMSVGCIIAVLAARGLFKRHGIIFANICASLGFVGLLASLVLINDQTFWPGYWTLLPVLSTGMIIMAGCSTNHDKKSLVAKLLGLKPFVYIGSLSFSIYLWHWVLLVCAQAKFGKNGQLEWWVAVIVLLLSVLCAYISKRVIEDPIRFSKTISSRRRITYSFGVGLMALSVFAGVQLNHQYNLATQSLNTNDTKVDIPTLGAMSENLVHPHFETILPNPMNAVKDTFTINNNMASCFSNVSNTETEAKLCEYGDLTSDETIIAVGDSMMRVWDYALDSFAKKHHYKVHSYTKSGCFFANAIVDNQQVGKYTGCYEWGKNVLQKILEEKPVMMVSTQAEAFAYSVENPDGPVTKDIANKGVFDYWKQISEKGIPITYIYMPPSPDKSLEGEMLDGPENYNINDCIVKNIDNLDKCQYYPQLNMQTAQKTMVGQYTDANVSTIEMNKYICYPKEGVQNDMICPAAVGVDDKQGISIYRDGPHLTDTFVQSITPGFTFELENAFTEQKIDIGLDLSINDVKSSYQSLTPNPLKANEDLPRSYDYDQNNNTQKCSNDNNNTDNEAKVCIRGDETSDKLVIAVGDSMMQQWETALDDWGKANGYKIHQYTKSACTFANAVTYNTDYGVHYDGCYEWGGKVLQKILEEKPVMFISSQVNTTALVNPEDPTSSESTRDAYVKGVYDYWNQITDAGIPITFILKNPIPYVSFNETVNSEKSSPSDCVSANLNDLLSCRYYPQLAHAQTQKEIIADFTGQKISTIDMQPSICYNNSELPLPFADKYKSSQIVTNVICPAVIGSGDHGTVVYRQGSHLTNTFVKSIESNLWKQLDAIMNTVK